MKNKTKPFLSKNNPIGLSEDKGEGFSYKYLLPNYWIGWVIIFISFFLTYIPEFLRRPLGTFVGLIIYRTNRKRRKIAEKNISLCFKNKNSNEIETITRNYFKNLGQSYLNIPILWWKNNSSLQEICSVENMHYIDNELSKNRSVILFTAHTVSLDFGGRSLSRFPIISMYKPFRNKLLNWFVGRARSKPTDNVVVFPREKYVFKNIIKALKQPVVFYYIADEDLGSKDSVFANFFDEPKATLTSIAKLSGLTNAAVIPCINHYNQNTNKFETFIDKPLDNFPSGNEKDDAKQINNKLEKLIARELDQYMWSLRLFQTRPDGLRYPYG